MQLFTNNADSQLNGALDAVSTTLVVKTGEGAKFPSPTGGDFFLVTLYQKEGTTEVNHEIVKCTTRSTDTLTIVRAQEGTTAKAFADANPVELRSTAGAMLSKQDLLVSATNIRTINGTTVLGSGNLAVGTVTSVTGTAPVVSSGGTTPDLSMAAATASVPGYLAAADFATFNAKQPAGTYATGTGSASGANTGDQTASSLGLGNVSNTADADKPVSTAQAAADTAVLNAAASDATSKANARQAALVSGTNIKTVGGVSLLGAGDAPIAGSAIISETPPANPVAGNLWWDSVAGALYLYYNDGSSLQWVATARMTKGDIYIAGGQPSLSGTTTIYINQSIVYTISNHNVFSTYAATVSAGTVSISGDTITVTAPGTAQTVTLIVTTDSVPTSFALVILDASIAAPTITSPANLAANVTGPDTTFASSAFAWLGLSDTHLNSDWQLATDAGFATIVQSTSADATNKTTWTTTLAVSTTYFVRVRHRGNTNGVSAYSPTVTFSTAPAFGEYIDTPTATPAAFGDSFEGGFYTGMIWNELVQTATSFAIGTGSKAFTVASMASVPLVYLGQTLEVRSRANPANKMIGTVTSARGTNLTLNITSVGGSGTFTDWSIMARYRVIVAPKSTGENTSITYKNANTAAPAACGTLTEGRKATLAMAAADTATVYPAAHFCNNLSIAGQTDWYIPARDELELCWRNLKPTADANYVVANRPTAATTDYKNLGTYGDTANTHGLNNNSSPTGAAYTTGSPAQTSVTAFRTGGSEVFVYGSSNYWSASEYNTTSVWAIFFGTSNTGYQGNGGKSNAYCVRAVRRSII
jgi:hypothetical protein